MTRSAAPRLSILGDLELNHFARQVIAHCRAIAAITDEPGVTARTFLGEATRNCHSYLSGWMQRLGMHFELDNAGNLRGIYAARLSPAKRLLVGSHVDTVPNAGAYDGVLGVAIALALVEALRGERLPFAIEVIAFSEEEGVRFGFPFIGSRALIGRLDEQALNARDHNGVTVRQAITDFGLDPSRIDRAQLPGAAGAYLEFHIEQGPVLDNLKLPLGVVSAIVGQSRALCRFTGKANHAGTTPMTLRQDALCAAAEWTIAVERQAQRTSGLVATVGKMAVLPGASNTIPGEVTATLDVRHESDEVRRSALSSFLHLGVAIAGPRRVKFEAEIAVDQPAVPMDLELVARAEKAIRDIGLLPHRMTSGAGHDAMVIASKLPSAMIFLRSPGGISHHPNESVEEEDVAAALRAGVQLVRDLVSCPYLT